jgi:cardiolipin synthase
VPPVSVLDALKTAALSGIDVRVMVPQESENWFIGPAVRSYYKECLKAGIKIYERGGGFIHSKTFVSDDYLSSIGTANIDNRSFNINYEVNTYIYDREVAMRNKAIFLKDLEISRQIHLGDLRNVPRRQRLFQKFIRLFASQL